MTWPIQRLRARPRFEAERQIDRDRDQDLLEFRQRQIAACHAQAETLRQAIKQDEAKRHGRRSKAAIRLWWAVEGQRILDYRRQLFELERKRMYYEELIRRSGEFDLP